MNAWIVSGLLYLLGVALAYQALRDRTDSRHQERFMAVAWPVLVVLGLAGDLYASTLGDWLWRRRHAKWCAEHRTERV